MKLGAFEAADDVVLPFAVEALDTRGRVVRLGSSIDTILSRHGYPDAVARALGEAAALTVLLGASLKFEGRFQLQTKSDGAIEMIVVDFDAPDRLRATARFDAGKIAALGPGARKTADLLGQGILAMTIDQGSERSRYQGVVALEGQGFEEAAHQYFRQSEQIPTRVRLAVAEEFSAGRRAWRAGGLMVQFLPASPERMRQADLPPGDIPEGHPAREAPPAAPMILEDAPTEEFFRRFLLQVLKNSGAPGAAVWLIEAKEKPAFSASWALRTRSAGRCSSDDSA